MTKFINLIMEAIKKALNVQAQKPEEDKISPEVIEVQNSPDTPEMTEITIKESPLLERIMNFAKEKSYIIFEDNSKDYNLNIWFIRSEDKTTDVFNDKCVVFWKSIEGYWNTKEFTVTTDPGLYWMTKPDYKEVAILAEGQYRGTHKIDTHKKGTSSAHEALCQRLGSVKVYRDGNKDDKHDFDVPTEIGSFGINCHRPTNYSESTGKVHASSAGCLVWAKRSEHDNLKDKYDTNTFMGLCRSSKELWGNKFTITLCTESNLH